MSINLKREDIGGCRGRDCGKSIEGVEFTGYIGSSCTHMKSEDGWWLRIDHHYDYWTDGHPRLPDTVGELLCPECLEKYNERMKELFGDFT